MPKVIGALFGGQARQMLGTDKHGRERTRRGVTDRAPEVTTQMARMGVEEPPIIRSASS